jgi:uncharacterized protein
MSGRLSQFAGQKYLSIETYRKTGEPVRTPVWFVEHDGILYIRTSDETGKYKRIGNNPSVQVAPCDMRGKIKGEWQKAEAKMVTGEEAQQAYQMMKQKYGIMYRMVSIARSGKNYVVFAIRVTD